MATTDRLQAFKRVQPVNKDTVSAREFVQLQANLEATLQALYKFNQTSVPKGVVVGAKLTAAQLNQFFSSSGLGLANTEWDGWAICNGNNGTTNMHGAFWHWTDADEGAGTSFGTFGTAGAEYNFIDLVPVVRL